MVEREGIPPDGAPRGAVSQGGGSHGGGSHGGGLQTGEALGAGSQRRETSPTAGAHGGVPRGVWQWGVLDAVSGALWSGPTAAFLSAFAVELGAGGLQLGLLLA